MRGRTITLVLCVVAVVTAAAAQEGAAQEGDSDTPRPLWRLSFDNDIVSNSDDGYSAGGSLERHSRPWDTWRDSELSGLSRFVGRVVPGLGDDGEGGRMVRSAWGLALVIQTPRDIEDPGLQLDDLPWAGTLGAFGSWTAVDDTRLNAVQLYLGCMGPCSQADEIQTFVHRELGLREIPQGWGTQLDTEVLVNLNYAMRRKLLSVGRIGAPGELGLDLAAGAQAGVGNFFNLADLSLELRIGWGLPRGFATVPDPAGRGVVVEPTVDGPPDHWQVGFAVVPRVAYYADVATLDGGDTADGRYHPGIDYDSTPFQVVSSLYVRRSRLSFQLSYYWYEDEILRTPTGTTLEWANLSFGYRF